jgi:hypothetical protein
MERQFESLKNILEDSDEEVQQIEQTISNAQIIANREETISQHNTNQHIQVQTDNIKMDPILEMFRNVKRNTSFKIEFTVENKIPRLDFIEMMEDSYNTSIIEFLAQEFTEEIIKDPDIIKEKIKDKLIQLVYPEENKQQIK